MSEGGTRTLYINEKKVGEGHIQQTVAGQFGIDAFGVGPYGGAPVSNTYKPPFAFNGQIEKVEIILGASTTSVADQRILDRYENPSRLRHRVKPLEPMNHNAGGTFNREIRAKRHRRTPRVSQHHATRFVKSARIDVVRLGLTGLCEWGRCFVSAERFRRTLKRIASNRLRAPDGLQRYFRRG
jgi:hypothetical protein